jgi:uncharacterized protein (TIGR02646 family)
MRRLMRPAAEPEALTRNKASWERQYRLLWEPVYGTPRAMPRPPNRTYNHAGVVDVLRAISHDKCFYCERKLKSGDGQVEHLFEVATHPCLAFEWRNLNLACGDCNRKKLSDETAGVADCAIPCIVAECTISSSARDPCDHVEFVGFRARGRDAVGRSTVEKYKLDREGIALQRADHLADFQKRHAKELARVELHGPGSLSEDERETLAASAAPDMPFSEMMRAFLRPLLSPTAG